jgi:hypothetical protein
VAAHESERAEDRDTVEQMPFARLLVSPALRRVSANASCFRPSQVLPQKLKRPFPVDGVPAVEKFNCGLVSQP